MQSAAQYIRMSTDHQRYSAENQKAAIAEYAAARGFDIVRTYEDLGVSGLSFKARRGLQQLVADVVGGQADYSTIIVYDVSRWGRFQDPDQSAHYEFMCREAGVAVEYCAEQFDNDGSPSATILKHLRRLMAAEYSRDLSRRVRVGQLRLAGQGYWMGGRPGYGLRRLLVDGDGEPKQVLEAGQRKAIQTDRVVLIHGPPEEVALVRWIFRAYVEEHLCFREIAARLNADGVPADNGARWTSTRLENLVCRPYLTGEMVFPRRSGVLGHRQRPTPPAARIRVPGVIEPIIASETFERAAQIRLRKIRRPPRTEMLQALQSLLDRDGHLSEKAINAEPGMPSADSYAVEFGSIKNAFAAVGFLERRLGAGAPSLDPHKDWIEAWLAAERQQPGFVRHNCGALRTALLEQRAAKVAYSGVWAYVRIWHGPGVVRKGRLIKGKLSTPFTGSLPAARGYKHKHTPPSCAETRSLAEET